MSTISNSRANAALWVVALLVVVGACRPPAGDTPQAEPVVAGQPPDAPMVRADSIPSERPQGRPDSAGYRSQYVPVELRSVAVQRVEADTLLIRLAGRPFLASATEPLAIIVMTVRPLGLLERTSSPEIYLNGRRIGDTWALDSMRLVAFLPDRGRLQPRNSVTVAWLDNEDGTMTRRPLTFTSQDLPQ
ncbi:MAG: hypothetical protein E4H37_05930 [Gemmatimonadales bacterium]|nr:MAG: hypothetical protein E4H37_05930 [Gemmatimonadales bacterium]